VAGFLKESIIAGALSLCAGTADGTPKAIGLDGTGDFYQQPYDGKVGEAATAIGHSEAA